MTLVSVMNYVKKPVELKAVHWNGGVEEAELIIEWVSSNGASAKYDHDGAGVNEFPHIRIATLEGVMSANPGDYIIQGLKGEFYPCKPDIFEMYYDLKE